MVILILTVTHWIANKCHDIPNIVCSAVMWCLWKFRNSLCFQGAMWLGEKMVLMWVVRMLRRWMPMFKLETKEQVEVLAIKLEAWALQPPEI
jgi:hypothetical protein